MSTAKLYFQDPFLFRFEARRFEVGRQADVKNILRLIGWTECLRVGTRERDQSRHETLPDTRICITCLERFGGKAGNPFQIS